MKKLILCFALWLVLPAGEEIRYTVDEKRGPNPKSFTIKYTHGDSLPPFQKTVFKAAVELKGKNHGRGWCMDYIVALICKVKNEQWNTVLPAWSSYMEEINRKDIMPGDIIRYKNAVIELGQPKIRHVCVIEKIHKGSIWVMDQSQGVPLPVRSRPWPTEVHAYQGEIDYLRIKE
jgi:hypothetical protein